MVKSKRKHRNRLRSKVKTRRSKTKQTRSKTKQSRRSSKRKYQKRIGTQRKSKNKRGGFLGFGKTLKAAKSVHKKWKGTEGKRNYLKDIAHIKTGRLKVNTKLSSLSAACKLMDSLEDENNLLDRAWCQRLKDDRGNFAIKGTVKLRNGEDLIKPEDRKEQSEGGKLSDKGITLNKIDLKLNDYRNLANIQAAEGDATTEGDVNREGATNTSPRLVPPAPASEQPGNQWAQGRT
tara:strand:+ start:13180 stop:13881 length:702 start_codon:yes stop_codon:yes gene_type:complete